ncbi:MAG: biopolymer transporter ExbD [Pirellulaceae bacterium]|nr:biopolymer transporter ExbD [Pirellulaceae bacterium]
MKIPSHVGGKGVDFNMTPMIDVVFLLIIFFLVSSHLAKQEVQMQLPLPDARSGTQAEDSQLPRLVVNISAGGQIRMAGRQLTLEQFQERLVKRREKYGQDLEVRIRSDRGVPYRNINPVMRRCAETGIWNVTFAVYRPGEER